MGRLHAEEFAALADRRVALEWHLTSNHYPPLPLSLLPAVEEAIALADAGEWNAHVTLPDGIRWRGEEIAPVHACVEGWHLHAFLSPEDDA